LNTSDDGLASLLANDPYIVNSIQSYMDGVNYFVQMHRNNLPLEYSILALNGLVNYVPEEFTASDLVGMGKVMGYVLTFEQYKNELNRYNAIKTFGSTGADDLYPLEQYNSSSYTYADLIGNMTTLPYIGSGTDILLNSEGKGKGKELPNVMNALTILQNLIPSIVL
ncbi:unnamed protein product, partial [marine sediment metagenome]